MWQEHVNHKSLGLVQGRKPFDPARPSLLMVHGAGGRGEAFLPQLSGLSGQVNVAAIDLPGHGDTPGPGLEHIQDYADWLADFLASGPLRPVLLGHSMGGATAMTLAAQRPELIRGLILVGTGARLKVMPALLQGLAQDFPTTVGSIVRFAYADQADPRLIEQGTQNMSQTPPQVLIGDFTACDRHDIGDRLAAIHLPTLVIVGDQDRLTPVKYSERLAEALPGSRLVVIKDAGHMAFLEKPQTFNETVLEFMAGF